MTAATALVSGNDPLPRLAEEAVHRALEKAGLSHANGVLLFMTPEFARHAQTAVTAAARAAQCTQVAGGIASGVLTETGWAVDRPAVAAMVLGRGLSLGHPEATAGNPLLSYAGGTFPTHWNNAEPCFGGVFAGSFTGSAAHTEAPVWQQSRIVESGHCSVQLNDADVSIAVSSGLHLLCPPQTVTASNGYDLESLDNRSAVYSLSHALPPELRGPGWQHLHQLTAVIVDDCCPNDSLLSEGRYRPVAVIAANTDNSLTLAERVAPGTHLAWAIRRTDAAEADMRRSLAPLARPSVTPSCALMFSCIGRGPYFYGGEDRDLAILREQFPGLPILGVYGTGQIAPATCGACAGNRSLQNAVVTALVCKRPKEAHVQSIA